MAGATFKVTNRDAPRLAATAPITRLADKIVAEVRAATPVDTGNMARSWRHVPGRAKGARVILNDAPYARYVEYGTRIRPAHAPLGRTLARYRR